MSCVGCITLSYSGALIRNAFLDINTLAVWDYHNIRGIGYGRYCIVTHRHLAPVTLQSWLKQHIIQEC